MTRVLLLTPCVFLWCTSPALEDEFPESRHFRLEKLADGVFAAIHIDEGGYAICNAGIIDLGDRTMVFDPFLTPAAADDLRLAAETLTKRPVSLVVNSHFHNDHIRGNQIFVPGAEIISSGWTREAISRTEPEEIAWERAHAPGRLAALEAAWDTASAEAHGELAMWKGYYQGMIESHPLLTTVLPTLTFDTTLAIHGSGRTVELMVAGRGHTMSDLVVHLPAEKIVFMGDLLFVGRHPWLADGFPDEWVRTLRTIHGWGVKTAVPGHGPVSGPDALLTMAAYLEALIALVDARVAAGQGEDDVAALAPPGEYARWWYGRFHPWNLRFLHKHAVEAARGRGP